MGGCRQQMVPTDTQLVCPARQSKLRRGFWIRCLRARTRVRTVAARREGGAASTSSAAASPRAPGCVEGAAGSQQRPAAGAGPEKQSNNDTWAQVPSTVAGRRVELGKISSLPEWAGDATETMGACVFAGPQ